MTSGVTNCEIENPFMIWEKQFGGFEKKGHERRERVRKMSRGAVETKKGFLCPWSNWVNPFRPTCTGS